MASLLKLDESELQATIGQLVKLSNADVIAACTNLAAALNPIKDDEHIVESCYEGLSKFQTLYNSTTPCTQGVIKNMSECCEIAEYLSKVNANFVQNNDVEFKTKTIDAQSVIQ